MAVKAGELKALFIGLNAAFRKGFDGVDVDWEKIAFKVPSKTAGENYSWLGAFPKMREWIGSRVIEQLSMFKYSLDNKPWESTFSVPRPDIEDDKTGIYGPVAQGHGQEAKEHPARLICDMLNNGFSETCYDGQNFFDAEHPVGDEEQGNVRPVSNMQDGAGAAWFVIDNTRPIKPVVYQERQKAEFTSLTDPNSSERVFMHNEFLFGAYARYNVGVSLWQLAFGSKAELTQANLRAAINAMKAFEDNKGRKLGIRPKILVIGPSNADKARDIIKAERKVDGASNTDRDILEIVELPYLD